MLKAKDIMTEDVICTSRTTPIYEAVKTMLEYGITGIPVVENNKILVGILTEKDVMQLHNAPDFGRGQTVDDYMTQPAVSFDEDESLVDICSCLIDYPFRRVPVTSNRKVVGIVSRRDIIKCIVALSEQAAAAKASK
jgi:CBS domain-containing protein